MLSKKPLSTAPKVHHGAESKPQDMSDQRFPRIKRPAAASVPRAFGARLDKHAHLAGQ